MSIVKTADLTKRFGELVAVDHISLEIEEKECFGLLGPNGAGKTSLIRMITGVSPATGGEIWVDNLNLAQRPREVKARLGVVPQMDNLDSDLTVLQNLLAFARYFNISGREARRRAEEALGFFELSGKQRAFIRELSGGMKRRLLLARGMINRPKILVLDEPTVGLDPQAKYLVWQKLKELKNQGVTQLISTQNMEEATALCDRVAVMNLGRVLALDAPRRLIKQYIGEKTWEIETSSDERAELILDLKRLNLEFQEAGSTIMIFNAANRLPARYTSVFSRPANLEDVFFKLTGRPLVE